MSRSIAIALIFALVLCATAISGCTSPKPPAAPVVTPPEVTIMTTTAPAPAAPLPDQTAATVKTTVPAPAEKVLLNEKGMISPSQNRKYDFKALSDQFSQLGEKYHITIKADKPVIGYAVTNYQAEQLGGDTLTPHFVAHSEKIQWGLIEPYMVLGKTDDKSQVFTVEEIAPYVYVVDARWMKSDDNYKDTAPFNYEITIAKVI